MAGESPAGIAAPASSGNRRSGLDACRGFAFVGDRVPEKVQTSPRPSHVLTLDIFKAAFTSVYLVACAHRCVCRVGSTTSKFNRGEVMQKIKDILKQLAEAEPYRPANSLHMQRYRKLSTLVLALSAACLLLVCCMAFWYRLSPLPALQVAGLLTGLLAILLAIVSLLIEPLAMVRLLRRWKTETLDTFIREVENDRGHVHRFLQYEEEDLEEVQRWLQLKIKRLDALVVLVFGSSAAAYSMLALTVSNMKDAGGFAWLQHTVFRGFAADNWGNNVILWGIALIFGLSIGAILRKVVQGRYIYQLEVVEMTLARKSAASAKRGTTN